MKKFFFFLILITIGVLAIIFRKEINIYITNWLNPKVEVNFDYKNTYYLKYNYKYFDKITDVKIENKQDLFNMYYNATNNGYDTFTFYCPDEYENCLKDLNELVFDQKKLSLINEYVHPFNSFQNIRTEYNMLGEVSLEIIKTYSQEDIEAINAQMQEIIRNEIKDEKDPRKIIKIVHDYIINNTKYDKERADNNIIKHRSNTAYGVLFEGYGICGGYTDAMALFLNYYDIPNFKIASENHIWNAVYLDGQWLHLDLTWDDPIISSGEEVLSYTYFLITTDELRKINDIQHNYDPNIFKEVYFE